MVEKAFDITEKENIELDLLLEAIYKKYGYDFRNYSKAHLRRRIIGRMNRSKLTSLSAMLQKLLNEPEFAHQLLTDLSLNTTEMFRDPLFFKAIRDFVIPLLKTYPLVKIWHAGCSTGEEVYSMAIILKEAGLLEKCLIYATDFNQIIVDQAAEALYKVDHIQSYNENYHNSGGTASLSNYFTVQNNLSMFDKDLRKNIVFANHNLVTNGAFGEMNMIICRNVLIYFNRDLQNKVIKLFYDSLIPGGILSIGSKETLIFSELKGHFIPLHKLNIFKKKYD